jgi:HD superfamily phosphodiesterase
MENLYRDALDPPEPDHGKDSLAGVAGMIAMTAICHVLEKYGDGTDGITATERELPYHNVQHTLSVRRAAERLSARLSLSASDQQIAVLAATAHDIVHMKPGGIAEQESAGWLADQMSRPGMGFSERDTQTARLAVLGTIVLTAADGSFAGQQAMLQDYPDQAAATVAACVASADMAQLYAPDGPLQSRNLYKERLGLGSADRAPLEGFLAFQKATIDLLERYQYPLPEAERLFAGLRSEVTDYQRQVAQDVFLGRIAAWDELIESDLDFYARCTGEV